MIPYFCFSVLAIAVNIIVYLVSGDGLKPVAVNVFETFSLIGIRTLWFLPTLYFAQIVLRLLGKLNFLIRLIAVVLLLALLMIAIIFLDEIKLNYLENAAFLSAKRTAAAVVFLYIGCLFEFLYRRYISNLRGLWYSAVIAAIFLIWSIFVCFFSTGRNSFASADFSCFPLFLLCSLPGSFGMIFFSIFIEKARPTIVMYFGRNSLVIMAVHFLPLDIFDKAGFFEMFGQACPLLFNLGEFAIVILICILFVYIINKYFLIILGKT